MLASTDGRLFRLNRYQQGYPWQSPSSTIATRSAVTHGDDVSLSTQNTQHLNIRAHKSQPRQHRLPARLERRPASRDWPAFRPLHGRRARWPPTTRMNEARPEMKQLTILGPRSGRHLPVLHRAALQALGLDWTHRAIMRPDELTAFLVSGGRTWLRGLLAAGCVVIPRDGARPCAGRDEATRLRRCAPTQLEPEPQDHQAAHASIAGRHRQNHRLRLPVPRGPQPGR